LFKYNEFKSEISVWTSFFDDFFWCSGFVFLEILLELLS